MALGPLVIQAGITMPGASAYALAAADLSPVVTAPFEPLASYDWVFGAEYPDFSDAITGTKLQPNLRLAITNGGTGYEASGPLLFTGGGATTPATGIWFATNGVIGGAYLTSPGAGYTSNPAVAAQTSAGTGSTITAVIGAAATLSANSLILPTSSTGGLILPVTETLDQTICAVVRVAKNPANAAVSILFGTLFQSAANIGGLSAGSAMFLEGANGYRTTTRPGSVASVGAPAGVADGGYAFVALSEAPGGGRVVYWGGPASTVYTATQVKTMAATPPKIALGPAYYGVPSYAHELAELIYIPRATTAAELDAVYARSKARMAARTSPIIVY